MSKSTADRLFERGRRHTTKNHLVAVVETSPDGSGHFRIDVSFGMNITEVCAMAQTLLEMIVDHTTDTSKSCECCADRRAHVQHALAALRAGQGDAPLSLH